MNQIQINYKNFFEMQSNFFEIVDYVDDDRGFLPDYFCNPCSEYPYSSKFILRIVVGYLNIENIGINTKYQSMIEGDEKKDNDYRTLLLKKIRNCSITPKSEFDEILINSVKNDNGKMIDIFYYMGLPHKNFTNLYNVYELFKDDLDKLKLELKLPEKTELALKKTIEDFKYSANNPTATGLQARHGKPQGKAKKNIVMTVDDAEKLICKLIHWTKLKIDKKNCCFVNDFQL